MGTKKVVQMYTSQSIRQGLTRSVETISAWPSWKIASVQGSSSVSLQHYIFTYNSDKNKMKEFQLTTEPSQRLIEK